MYTGMSSTCCFLALVDQIVMVAGTSLTIISQADCQRLWVPSPTQFTCEFKRKFGHLLWLYSRSFDCVVSNIAETFHETNLWELWMRRSGNSRAFNTCEKTMAVCVDVIYVYMHKSIYLGHFFGIMENMVIRDGATLRLHSLIWCQSYA